MSGLRSVLRSRPPPLAYGAVLLLGAVSAPLLLSLDGGLLPDLAYRRSLSNGSLYSLKNSQGYSNLQDLRDIDPSIENRARKNNDPDRCSRLFLYLPDPFADHGHGSQINTYIMGVSTSTYLDRAMLLVEPPPEVDRYAGGSQFGCPVDAFRETMTKTSSLRRNVEASWEVKEDFPRGFSRLVDHPAWLSRKCAVPTSCDGREYRYGDWLRVANSYKSGEFEEVTCENPDGTVANVVVAAGSRMRMHYRKHEPLMTRDHPSPHAEKWATNLGATPREAKLFSKTVGSREVWDYVLGLMNKAGFLKLRPWIARDVELLLRTYDLPLDREYDAVHVRRGDKLEVEARKEVEKYWRENGHPDPNDLPTDYIPFAHYLSQWDGPETCERDEDGKVSRMMDHNVYVATDDPVVVRGEIAALPDHVDENTIRWNECHRLRFYFNPTDDDAFHLNGDGESGFKEGREGGDGDSCFGRHHRNVASVADMMVLAKAKTFIGEYNSNWGRVIRTLRVRLNVPAAIADGDGGNEAEKEVVMSSGLEGLTRVLDTRVAWGATIPRSPGY